MSAKLPNWWYTTNGWPEDRRQRKKRHRQLAKKLIEGGTLLNPQAPRGSTPWEVAQWHKEQARKL